MSEVLVPLSERERAVLEIAARGECMMEIGIWEQPIKALLKRGYLDGPQFNRFITAAGEAAIKPVLAEAERNQNAALAKVMLVDAFRNSASEALRAMAVSFVALAEESAAITGKTPSADADRWFVVLREEVERLLKEKADGG